MDDKASTNLSKNDEGLSKDQVIAQQKLKIQDLTTSNKEKDDKIKALMRDRDGK